MVSVSGSVIAGCFQSVEIQKAAVASMICRGSSYGGTPFLIVSIALLD